MSNTSPARSILITGCSSGIGLACARGLRARGWRVFASCRKAEDCTRLQDAGFDAPLLDYADEATIEAALADVLAATGGTLDAGRIVQCSSVLGLVAMPWRGSYNSTKFAIEGLTDTLRLEMRGTGVYPILIEPGPVTSKIRENSIPHFEKWIDWPASPRKAQYEAELTQRLYHATGKDTFELPPEAVLKKLVHAIEAPRPRPRYYVTTPTYIAGILRRLLPTRALDWVTSR